MIQTIFKNLERSELAKEIVYERMQAIIEQFPDLYDHRIVVTLSMDNSPLKPGPDLFKVKLLIAGKKFKNIVLEKSAISLYLALADVVEHTLERLNRFGDKRRIKNRNLSRRLRQSRHEQKGEDYEENRF